MKRSNISRRASGGFTLTEVVVALGLFVFAITALMGMLPFGMNQVQASSNESIAMAQMESIRDDVALTLATKMPTSLRYGIRPAANGNTAVDLLVAENGEVVTGGGTAAFRVVGTLRAPADPANDPVYLHLRATWPPRAPAGRESGSVELITAFRP